MCSSCTKGRNLQFDQTCLVDIPIDRVAGHVFWRRGEPAMVAAETPPQLRTLPETNSIPFKVVSFLISVVHQFLISVVHQIRVSSGFKNMWHVCYMPCGPTCWRETWSRPCSQPSARCMRKQQGWPCFSWNSSLDSPWRMVKHRKNHPHPAVTSWIYCRGTRELPGIKVSNSNMQHHPATKLTGIYATISSVDHSDILLEFISSGCTVRRFGRIVWGNPANQICAYATITWFWFVSCPPLLQHLEKLLSHLDRDCKAFLGSDEHLSHDSIYSTHCEFMKSWVQINLAFHRHMCCCFLIVGRTVNPPTHP